MNPGKREAAVLEDVRGRCIPLGQRYGRIVSLIPSDTYSIFALGAGTCLVGRTQFCVHPRPEVDALPAVGGTKTPKIKDILALSPDLVLANREENRAEDVAALEAEGIPVFVSQPATVADSVQHLRDLAALTGQGPRGDALARRLSGEISPPRAGRPRPLRALYLIWRGPYMGVAPDTYIYQSLVTTGFLPLCPEGSARYPELSPEFIRESGAEVVLFPSEPFVFQQRHMDAFAAAFPELPAVRAGALRLLPGEHGSWHGAWALKGIPALARLRESLGDILPAEDDNARAEAGTSPSTSPSPSPLTPKETP